MIPISTFAGKQVAVFGLGGSGLASCHALKAGGAEVVACDDDAGRVAAAAQAGFATAPLRDVDWRKVAALVLAPGVPLTHPKPHAAVGLARAAGVEVIGDIELFCRERCRHAPQAPFVAITGTNGKSTTTALIAHLLRSSGLDVQLGGNIGTAILSLEPPRPGRVHVIEVSSYQIDLAPTLDPSVGILINLSEDHLDRHGDPSVGILINLSEDHLDRHGTMRNYAAVKERLVARVQQGGAAIVGVDDEWSRAAADRIERLERRVTRVSVLQRLTGGLYVEDAQILRVHGGSTDAIADLHGIGSLRGLHNFQNAACAAAAALAIGLSPAVIQAALRSFPGLAHRMEEVGRQGRVLFVNDSKATNADSAARALACYSDIFWIAGGKPKTGGIASLSGYFPRIRKAYLIGEAAAGFAAALERQVPFVVAGTLDRAVALAAEDAAAVTGEEPVVLLSPACASFDQFRNFEVRGDRFRELVRGLSGIALAKDGA